MRLVRGNNASQSLERITTVHDRYQICDPTCGLIETSTTKSGAFFLAQSHARNCEGVEVFDVMARNGAPQTWDSKGKLISRKVAA